MKIKKLLIGFVFTFPIISIVLSACSINSTSIADTTNNNNNQSTKPKIYDNNLVQFSSNPQNISLSDYYNNKNAIYNFDNNWKFNLGDVTNAQNINFDDSNWKNINLPHDYSLIQDYNQNGEAESGYKLGGIGWYRKNFILDQALKDTAIFVNFDGAYQTTEIYVNGIMVGENYYGYIGFTYDISKFVWFGKENIIAVKTNNPVPTSRYYSGSGIYRDVQLKIYDKIHIQEDGIKFITPDLETNQENPKIKIEVDVKNATDKNSEIQLKSQLYQKNTNGLVGNQLDVIGNNFANKMLSANQINKVTLDFKVVKPNLWDIENPNLYVLKTSVFKNNALIQTIEEDVGFRYFAFNKDSGFSLNGKKIKLKGVSMHHDQGGLGARAYADAVNRQFQILKEMGTNAVRVTHNPAAEVMRKAANRYGILLIDEAYDTWSQFKNGNYNDNAKYWNYQMSATVGANLVGGAKDMLWRKYNVKKMVLEGRNDPSIIMWSTGNEVFEGVANSSIDYVGVINELITWIYEIDQTRFVTIGDNKIKENWTNAEALANALASISPDKGLKGIVGLNYANRSQYDAIHSKFPNWIIYGSETASSINSRGEYTFKGNTNKNNQRTAYDQSAVGWGQTASNAWYDTITRDFVAGEFVWTGFDYLGEPTPWNGVSSGPVGLWPLSPKSSYFGIIDTAGIPKDSYYFYQSQWSTSGTTLHILPTWNASTVSLDQQKKVEVVIYSNAASVELFFTPKNSTTRTSLGTKSFTEETTSAGFKYQIYKADDANKTNIDKNLYLTWKVPYADGTITAVAKNATGKIIQNTKGRSSVTTFGAAAKLKTVLFNGNNTDQIVNDKSLFYIRIKATDVNNNFVSNYNDKVTVKVNGPAVLAALDNGNATDHQSYQENNRKAYNGELVAILQATGESGSINVEVSASGLKKSILTINAIGESKNLISAKTIESYEGSRIYYLKKGGNLQLPQTLNVNLKDKTTSNLPVNWNLTPEILKKIKNGVSTTVTGMLGKKEISVQVNVIDKIQALKNYSSVIAIGSPISLPKQAQAFLADGSLVETQFPVKWNNYDPSKVYNKVGKQEFVGKAFIFGEFLELKASVLVKKLDETISGNVAPNAAKITADQISDNLKAIVDGNTASRAPDSKGVNHSIWTNFDAVFKKRILEANITFTYDTAQSIRQVTLYFFTDTYAAALPAKVKFFAGGGAGQALTEVNATQFKTDKTIGNIIKRVYDLKEKISAVEFKIQLTAKKNNQGLKISQANPVIGLSEVEFATATEVLVVSSDPSLSSIKVNGRELISKFNQTNDYTITDSNYKVNDHIEVNSITNTAVTILPKHNGQIKIFVTSEDGKLTRTYIIKTPNFGK